MNGIFYKYLLAVFVSAFAVQCAAAYIGDFLRRRRDAPIEETMRKHFATILPVAWTLLGLIIGFGFSMASNRYDQRKASAPNMCGRICCRQRRRRRFANCW
jgi:hypothetical protein